MVSWWGGAARSAAAVAVAAAFLVAAPTGSAQIQSCGEGLELFIRNPDIVPDANGVDRGRFIATWGAIYRSILGAGPTPG